MRLIALFAFLAAACSADTQDLTVASSATEGSLAVHTATNPSASFDRYRTFSFGPAEGAPPGYETSPRYVEVQRRIHQLIANELTAKGYKPAAEAGDFFVMFGAGRREVSTHTTSSISAEWLPDDENADFVEGAIVIDIFDTAHGTKVWHGASRANIDPEHIDPALIQRAVHGLLGPFPAATAAPGGGM